MESPIDRITRREAEIEAGIDGPTVRRILERLATKARSVPDGMGSLGPDDIVAAFREVCGYPPDHRGMLLLQRLPGLGIEQGELETRRFIDESFAESCRAGDVHAFAENPYDTGLFQGVLDCTAGSLGWSVAAVRFQDSAFPTAKLRTLSHEPARLVTTTSRPTWSWRRSRRDMRSPLKCTSKTS